MKDRCSGRMKRRAADARLEDRGTTGGQRRFGRALYLMTALFLAAFLTGGCGAGFPFAEEEDAAGEYTKSQAMIIVATERNRYEQVYTDRIWNVTLTDGRSFGAYLLEQVETFLTNLKRMNLLAEEQGVVLTSAEQSRLQSLSARYYEGLSDADKAYTGATEKDVQAMYQEYYLANKVVGQLTDGIDLEVSDSDAKVITVRMIQISSEAAAEAVYRRVSQDGSNFLTVARETSEGEQIELSLGRGELPEAADEAAFALSAGEMSPLIACDGWYYIFQCVSDYDAEATALRKTRIYEERKNQVFQQICAQAGTDSPAVFTENFWPEIRLTGDDTSTTTNFFALYEEEFGSQ